MLDKLKGALGDVAETLRQVFSNPSCLTVNCQFPARSMGGIPAFASSTQPGLEDFQSRNHQVPILEGRIHELPLQAFLASVQGEKGPGQWETTTSQALSLFPPGAASHLHIPALPKKAGWIRRMPEPWIAPKMRIWSRNPASPKCFSREISISSPMIYVSMRVILGLPVPFRSMDLSKIPKGTWMRYSLQMVKSTGENVRNLEVVGIFPQVPKLGVLQIRMTGIKKRLLLRLDARSLEAPRGLFLVAKRISDNALLTCYVE